MKIQHFITLFLAISLASCGGETLPKPKAMLKLEYPETKYTKAETNCTYTFGINNAAQFDGNQNCNLQIKYPFMKGAIYLTYRKVNGNIEALLRDAQKLTFEHTIKANNIAEQPYINEKDNVYGMFYEVSGNAASQSQFYVTDSVNHFVTGSLYFYAKPNYDSILPAAEYLKKDIRKIMETINWK